MDENSLLRENQLLTQEVKKRTEEVQRHIDRLTALNEVATTVGQSLDLDRTLQKALEAVTRICHAEAGGISLIEEGTQDVVLQAQLGWSNDFVNAEPMRIPAGEGMSGIVIARDEVLVVSDLNGGFDFAVPSFRQEEFRSLVMTPMHARGNIIGILSIMSQNPNHFDDQTIEILKTVADTIGVALENARLYARSIEGENRMAAILQSSADGILATDKNGAVIMVNPSAADMLGVEQDKLLTENLRQIELPPTLKAPLQLALSSREDTVSRSFQVTMPNGRILMVFVSDVWSDSGAIDEDGWVVVFQDVTHLRAAEQIKAEFIQAAAHDMRNPIGVTMTSLGTLQSLVEDELAQEVIEVAFSGVNRLQALIDDLLNLERIENGYDFRMNDIDMTELLYECVAQVQPLARQKSQSLIVNIMTPLGFVQGDSHWLSRAMINYLGNASKYTQEGGRIQVNGFIRDGQLHIEVVDNGPGIPVDVQTRLFERFYRVKEASQERGSGLGLAIVRSVIEAHGGSVYVRSRVGEGSTFGLALPTA
jgi:PAS domain S-box-containing protein